MADYTLVVLFYGHILSAVSWLGGGILTTFVVGPGVRGLSPPSGTEFMAKVMPRILRFIQAAIGSTFLFGILLYYYLGIQDGTSTATAVYAGVVVALATAAVVFSVTIPSFRKVIKLANERMASGGQGPPPPEMMKYSRRARIGSTVAVSMLLLVLVFMVLAATGY
ncbi:MAG: hypothetical protein HY296_05530 [Thaumarchaeota archaeon]|nr:hypothetical protein [Nitrososphaerota archaeon]